MMFLLSDDLPEDTSDTLYGFLMFGAAIENTIAVGKARKLTQSKQLQANSPNSEQLPDLQIEILKIGKAQGEMTLSDFVIATETSPDKVKTILMELERSDLVRSYNREPDGVIVYKVI
jgi:uncharacterized membrane protein